MTVDGAATRPGTIDPAEIERFSRIAADWWDPDGKFRPLHRLNPARLAFIRDHLLAHFGRDGREMRPFSGLRLLDIGCGGGLIAEPMARLGFAVTGIDADSQALAIARRHAADGDLDIGYREAAVEDLVARHESYDAVLALEVVEHVAEPELFLAGVASLVRPEGGLVASTLNRTAKSFLFAVLGAEYVLGWLPRGTHEWQKFLRPSELAAGLRPQGLSVSALAGLTYEPWRDGWKLSNNLGINYLLFATKPGAS